jgi:hypothetical protein
MAHYHDHKLRGHPGEKRTMSLVNQLFFWKGHSKDIRNYVRSCQTCQRAKASRHKPYGNLKPLPIGEHPWSSISMDHIVQLPKSGEEDYDAILVVVDRLTKQGIFIPCHVTDNAATFAKLFVQHIFSKHGLPTDIVSDRGALFVSQFWRELLKLLDIEAHLSTVYHPQTNGQTECVNQSLETYIRIYCEYDQDNWVDLLPLAEFVYNNSPHHATGVTPFFANKGYHPKLSINLRGPGVELAEVNAYTTGLRELQEYLKVRIVEANKEYVEYADRK